MFFFQIPVSRQSYSIWSVSDHSTKHPWLSSQFTVPRWVSRHIQHHPRCIIFLNKASVQIRYTSEFCVIHRYFCAARDDVLTCVENALSSKKLKNLLHLTLLSLKVAVSVSEIHADHLIKLMVSIFFFYQKLC